MRHFLILHDELRLSFVEWVDMVQPCTMALDASIEEKNLYGRKYFKGDRVETTDKM